MRCGGAEEECSLGPHFLLHSVRNFHDRWAIVEVPLLVSRAGLQDGSLGKFHDASSAVLIQVLSATDAAVREGRSGLENLQRRQATQSESVTVSDKELSGPWERCTTVCVVIVAARPSTSKTAMACRAITTPHSTFP